MNGEFISAAFQGMSASLGQEHTMTGWLTALWRSFSALPGFFVGPIAGLLADHVQPRLVFLLTAGAAATIFSFSWIRPRAVYEDPAEKGAPLRDSLWSDFRRLFGTPALYPCMALLFLWNFTPGVGTTMFYYLTNTLHGTNTQWGLFNAVFGFFFIPTYLLHGFLSRFVRLRTILWISTLFAVPQILPLMLVHDAQSAILAGIPMGLMGGFATAAYFDLLMRACPAGLQGSMMMLGASIWALSDRLGNLAGGWIYDLGGFRPCALATVGVYACLIPVLFFVPKQLTATRDGERLPGRVS